MQKIIAIICFYVPLVISTLNIQGLISNFISPTIAQLVAYINLVLILTGIFLFRKSLGVLSVTNRLWFIFYFLYYSIGILALGTSGFEVSIISTLVPVIFFTGFYFFLSNKKQFAIFFRVVTVCYVISAFITIVLIKLNIDPYTGNVYKWALDRAGGITGDANAAAHNSIFAFIFFNQLFKPTKFFLKIIKAIVLLTIFYSLILTYSTTGLFTFTIVFFFLNYKFFRGIKLILIAAVIPLFYLALFSIKSQVKDFGLSAAQTTKVNNIVNLLTFDLDNVDNSGRGVLLEDALYYLFENPITGNGVDFAVNKHAHNTYFGIWIDGGIFTFVFFLFILGTLFYRTVLLNPDIRFFGISILIVFYIFMMSLQSVINQHYLIVLFVFVGYLIDHGKSEESADILKL